MPVLCLWSQMSFLGQQSDTRPPLSRSAVLGIATCVVSVLPKLCTVGGGELGPPPPQLFLALNQLPLNWGADQVLVGQYHILSWVSLEPSSIPFWCLTLWVSEDNRTS